MKDKLYEFITNILQVFDVCILGHTTHPGGSLIRKLQHTKRFLLWSRHFIFVTSRTEREERGLRMRSKLEYLLFRSLW
jgi:hypothetical protein